MTYSSDFPNIFLSLDRYAKVLGFDPLRFFQSESSISPQFGCDDIWYQMAWQDGGKISREELRQAIRQAEEDIILQTKYFPSPYWYTETVDYPQYYTKELRGVSGYNAGRFRYKTVNTSKKYVIQGGARATSKIDASDIVRGSDIDTTGDGFDDTAVFTVTVDFTNTCELKAYFKEYNAADVANTRTDPGSTGADKYWEIEPIRTKISGTTATVYIPIYLLIKPQLQRQIDASVIDADSASSYVDTIEFYRVYNDSSNQATFLWTSESSCNSTSCAWATQTGCIRVHDARRGIVTVVPATYSGGAWNEGYFNKNREPDKVILNYYSGFRERDERNCDELSHFWAYNIAVLATARLNKQVCACENIARRVMRWQEDIALVNGTRSYNVNIFDLSNPFGTTLGAIEIWNRIKNRGVRVGQNITTY